MRRDLQIIYESVIPTLEFSDLIFPGICSRDSKSAYTRFACGMSVVGSSTRFNLCIGVDQVAPFSVVPVYISPCLYSETYVIGKDACGLRRSQ